MVFSSANEQSEQVAVSPYGIINVDIRSTPLLQGTTVKDYILFTCDVQILNCTRTTLQSLLGNLQNEILTKVDILLAPLNGQVNDGNSGNIPYSTLGFGVVNIKVQPTALVQGTSNPEEVVFRVEVQMVSCNRTRLANFLNGLNAEIMDKVNDVL